MPSYTITNVGFSAPPSSGNQTVSVWHKLTAAPDSTYVLDSALVQVTPNGTLVVPYTIAGLNYNTSYTVKVTNNCGGGEDTIIVVTSPSPCPDIIGIAGTSGPINMIVAFHIYSDGFGTFNDQVQDNTVQVI